MSLFQAVVIGVMVWFGGFLIIDRICSAIENCSENKWKMIKSYRPDDIPCETNNYEERRK